MVGRTVMADVAARLAQKRHMRCNVEEDEKNEKD